VLRPGHLISRVLDLRVIDLKLRLQLWDLENRHDLASLHVGSVINH
jgi:hypothetical protein